MIGLLSKFWHVSSFYFQFENKGSSFFLRSYTLRSHLGLILEKTLPACQCRHLVNVWMRLMMPQQVAQIMRRQRWLRLLLSRSVVASIGKLAHQTLSARWFAKSLSLRLSLSLSICTNGSRPSSLRGLFSGFLGSLVPPQKSSAVLQLLESIPSSQRRCISCLFPSKIHLSCGLWNFRNHGPQLLSWAFVSAELRWVYISSWTRPLLKP